MPPRLIWRHEPGCEKLTGCAALVLAISNRKPKTEKVSNATNLSFNLLIILVFLTENRKRYSMTSEIIRDELDAGTRFIHLGLAGFGILAWLTGYLAGDYKTARYFWFNLHKWCGLGLAGFLACCL